MSLNLLGVFTAGLFTFVTPCVLPLVPIYLGALLGGDLKNLDATRRGQLLVRALLFSVGFVGVFTLLGLGASAVGGLLLERQAALQIAGGILILVFGLKFMGLIQIPLLDRVVRGDETRVQTRVTSLNALLMGVFFAAGWSPCVGPVLGSVLTYTASTTSDPWVGAGYLGLYGLGFALPLLLTAVFAEAGIRFLKRINPWLPRIERGLGVVLLVVAVGMIADAAPAGPPAQAGAVDPVPTAVEAGVLSRGGETAPTPMMLELFAEDCPVCERMMPVVDRVASDCDGRNVHIRQVDVSKPGNRHLIAQHRLVGVPTFLFLDDEGHEVARLVGEQTESALRQALSTVRGESCEGVGPVPGAADGPPEVPPPFEAEGSEEGPTSCAPPAAGDEGHAAGVGSACDPNAF